MGGSGEVRLVTTAGNEGSGSGGSSLGDGFDSGLGGRDGGSDGAADSEGSEAGEPAEFGAVMGEAAVVRVSENMCPPVTRDRGTARGSDRATVVANGRADCN